MIKKIVTVLIIGILSIVVAGLIFAIITGIKNKIQQTSPALRGGNFLANCFSALGSSASTSLTYLASPNATSTIIEKCDISRADNLSINFDFGATTSPTTLYLSVSFSRDGSIWRNETFSTQESNNNVLTLGATSSRAYLRQEGGVGTTSKNITIPNISDKFMRVEAKAVGASGGHLYLDVVKRENTSN